MAVVTYIDGVQATVLSGSWTPRLNLNATATVRMPLGLATGDVGSRLKIVDNGTLVFHGMVLTVSDEGDEDKLYTEYVASDPMELWRWRPARDGVASGDPGDFSNPTFMTRLGTGPQILQEILTQSEDIAQGEDDAEGALFISYDSSSFETGGVDLSGAPVDWPMTIAEIASLLTSTGEVDIVLTPIDSGGNMASLHVYNGDYGTNLSGSVSFDFKTGQYNARAMRRVRDVSNVCNKLWYYLGPRVQTSADPGGLQHWKSNVTATDSALEDPPQTDIDIRRYTSQGDYGVRMDVKVFDADTASAGKALYARLWQTESWIRADAREMVHVTPVRNTPLNFGIGDLIGVSAGADVRGGFSGSQRVYQFTYAWDEDGVTEITEIVTSPTQEGI